MTLVKGAALLVATSVAVGGGLLYVGRDTTVTVNCGPTVDRPAVSTVFALSDKVTGSFNAVASGKVGLGDVAAAWLDTRAMGELIAGYTVAGGRETTDERAEKIKADIEAQTQAGLAACCPTVATAPQLAATVPPLAPSSADVASSNSALAAGGGKVAADGPDLAAAALRAAAPDDTKWLAQIPLGVSIANYESSFRHDAANSVNTGHVGYWQISGANAATLKLGERTDPYANARYAYALWKGRGGTWSKDWSVYKTAVAHASEYARYGTDAPTTAVPQTASLAAPTTPTVGCPTAAAPGIMPSGLKVGTWNSYYGPIHPGASGPSGEARIRKAVAALVSNTDAFGLQEMSDPQHRKWAMDEAGSGIGWVGMDTSQPIGYHKSRFTLAQKTSDHVFTRDDDYEGPGQGERWVNSAELVDTTGRTVTVVNLHQLPQIQADGVLYKEWPKRIGWAKRLWSKAFEVANRAKAKGGVVVVGDMNFTGDPDGMYAAAGMLDTSDVFGNVQKEPGKRDIDKTLVYGGTPTSTRSLGNFGSDHEMRVTTWPAAAVQAPVASVGSGAVPGAPADPNARVTVDGKQVSAITAWQLALVTQKTGLTLRVMQGGYGGSHIAASGTSHNYPGVVDVACSGATDCVAKETGMRQAGFAAWARNVPGRSQVGSGEHVHGVSLLDDGSRTAPQVTGSWPNDGNGLSGYHNDPAPHPALWPELTALGGR